jgi:membrane-bound lytic murein transglycosylase D
VPIVRPPLLALYAAAMLAAMSFSGLSAGTEAQAGEMLAMNGELSTSLLNGAPPLPALTAPQPAQPATDIQPTLTTDSNLPQNNLWQRIRSGFALPDLDTPLVARHEQWYASQPDYVARMSDRARLYLYFIVREVERRGMPTEIALLPMIESAFNPTAYSVSNASGIWQFIPSTGKHFGMEQNWWHDDRRDIISATNGALDYLQNLHDQFGDWELALAAYNYGEHGLQRAIERNLRHHKPIDLLSLKLPRETRNYVPKLLAMKHIISDPSRFGLVLADIPNDPYFAAISPPHHIDVSLAAELAGMTMEEFHALNPAHSRPVILHDDSTLILLPADKTDTFMANLEAHDKPLVSWQPYQSKKGEPLDKVAARFGISVEKLKSANGIRSYTKISDGRKLLVPATSDGADEEFAAFNMHLAPTLDESHLLIHIVHKGETLGGIALRYHVSTVSLKARNGHRTLIRPGQRLIIAGVGSGSVHRRHHTRLAKASKTGKPASQAKTTSVSALATAGSSS